MEASVLLGMLYTVGCGKRLDSVRALSQGESGTWQYFTTFLFSYQYVLNYWDKCRASSQFVFHLFGTVVLKTY